MPIYDYECAGCGHSFELRQGFDSEPVETCPRCQGRAQRRFHSPAVIYKGSGFYTTDYGRKTVSKSSESDSPKVPASSSAPSSTTPADGSAGGSKAIEGSRAKESPISTV